MRRSLVRLRVFLQSTIFQRSELIIIMAEPLHLDAWQNDLELLRAVVFALFSRVTMAIRLGLL